MDDVVDLTQKLIRCKSVTPHDDGAQQVLITALEKIGFQVTRLKYGQIENFYARYGTGSPHICYGGHTDVVPAGDESRWSYPPFSATLHDGVIYGRGSSDMKASNAAFLVAAKKFLEENAGFKGSISLLITGDEEAEAVDGTVRVLSWMKDHNHIPDLALVGEPTNPKALGDEIKIGRRGSLSGLIKIKGRQGHVAYPDRADNAAVKINTVLTALIALKLDEGTQHFPPSSLVVTSIDVGNPTYNLIPEFATARFNIRYNDCWTHDGLSAKLNEVISAITNDYSLEIKDGANVFLTTPGPMTNIVMKAVQDITGRVPNLSTGGGTSDARFFARYCPVVECGPVNATIHKTDENIDVDTLQGLVRIYERVLTRFFSDFSS